MSHLTTDSLARIVDEPATAIEQEHLDACASCRSTLAELRAQTAALAALPVHAPPADAWESIGRRMQAAERRAEDRRRIFAAATRIAAAILFFALGAGAQALFAARRGASAETVAGETASREANRAATASSLVSEAPKSLDEATTRLRLAETVYTRALLDYAALSSPQPPRDAVARLATLEAIVLTTRAALERAPADPLINTYHLAAQAERETLLEQLRRRPEAGQWY